MLEFRYNSKHSATGFSPFELATGKQVLTPLALVSHVVRDKVEYDVNLFLTDWQATMHATQQGLKQTKERMVQAANKKRQTHRIFSKAIWSSLVPLIGHYLGRLLPKFNHLITGHLSTKNC